jgi:hypothetical protein
MKSKPKKLYLWLIPLALSGCATNTTAPVAQNPINPTIVTSDYCRINQPLTYDSAVDSPETQAQIERHNSRYACVCEDDCPQKPGETNPIP